MKNFGFVFLTMFLVALAGCNDDEGYSLSNTWVGFGILHEGSQAASAQIVMDNGDILLPVVSNQYQPWYDYGRDDVNSALEIGDRVLVNYTLLGDKPDEENSPGSYYVRINSIKKILLKGVIDITAEKEDSIGNDPVIVKDCWMSDSLLNFNIKYWGRDLVHFINLVKQPGELTADSQPVKLELRHNNNDDSEEIPFAAYVSFKLTALQIAGLDSVKFSVTSTDYDGEVFEYKGTYHYGKN